jgi:hypothetical protein
MSHVCACDTCIGRVLASFLLPRFFQPAVFRSLLGDSFVDIDDDMLNIDDDESVESDNDSYYTDKEQEIANRILLTQIQHVAQVSSIRLKVVNDHGVLNHQTLVVLYKDRKYATNHKIYAFYLDPHGSQMFDVNPIKRFLTSIHNTLIPGSTTSTVEFVDVKEDGVQIGTAQCFWLYPELGSGACVGYTILFLMKFLDALVDESNVSSPVSKFRDMERQMLQTHTAQRLESLSVEMYDLLSQLDIFKDLIVLLNSLCERFSDMSIKELGELKHASEESIRNMVSTRNTDASHMPASYHNMKADTFLTTILSNAEIDTLISSFPLTHSLRRKRVHQLILMLALCLFEKKVEHKLL